tara:strand:+ start:84 stop:1061 length:978 start_codon:yes stop_codon:yes gene_type:complete
MSDRKSGVTYQNNVDGSSNPKYVDLLEEDKPISGQKFVCVSFVSPENILVQKNHFLFQEFLKHYDFSKSVEKFTQFLNFVAYKHNIEFDDLMKNFQEYVKSEGDSFPKNHVSDEYKNFLDANEERLDDEFNKVHDFQTSVRGLKIRGTYSTQEEAELRCKLLREVDPNHNVYVGPVGMWMPWEPEAYKTGRVEYLEEELNQLMNEKNKNEADAKQQFEKRILQAKRDAIEENKKIAKKTGNKLTQNVDKDGNLVGVNNTIENVFDNKEEVSSADIRKELFEGGNIERGGAVKDAIERGILNSSASETSLNNVNINISEKTDDTEN